VAARKTRVTSALARTTLKIPSKSRHLAETTAMRYSEKGQANVPETSVLELTELSG